MIKVSDYIIKYLEKLDVQHMFMLPGGGSMHLNDSLGNSNKIKFVTCLHEQACAIAAEAYSRVNNKIGLLMVTTGPGGTNAITGVAAAYIESTPMLILSGQVKLLDQIRNQGVRQQGMQEVDIISIVKPITKYAVMVTKPEEIRYHLECALYMAMHGRKGPVWLDIPLDVQASMIDEDSLIAYDSTKSYWNRNMLVKQVRETIDYLNKAKRPVLLAGNGIRLADSTKKFTELIERLEIPVITSWNGIDLIEDNHPLYFGRPGGMGHRYANFIQQNSDFFLSIGARMNLLQTGYNFDGFARAAKRIMVDIDEAELHKINVRPDLPICADANNFITCFLEHIDLVERCERKEWFLYAQSMKEKYPIVQEEYWQQEGGVNSYIFLDKLSDQLNKNDIYVAGSSGTSIDISMQTFKVKKGQRVFCTKGLASMGFGLPAAIGACLAGNRRRTVCVTGDGGIQMNIQELQTLKSLNLPVKIFVLNNAGYAQIYATQSNIFEKHFVACHEESGLSLPSISKIAKAYGIHSIIINNNIELVKKIEECLKYEGPVVCEVIVPISLNAQPKQVSYKRSDGFMESLPLEYMNPLLSEEEFQQNMLIPLYKMT